MFLNITRSVSYAKLRSEATALNLASSSKFVHQPVLLPRHSRVCIRWLAAIGIFVVSGSRRSYSRSFMRSKLVDSDTKDMIQIVENVTTTTDRERSGRHIDNFICGCCCAEFYSMPAFLVHKKECTKEWPVLVSRRNGGETAAGSGSGSLSQIDEQGQRQQQQQQCVVQRGGTSTESDVSVVGRDHSAWCWAAFAAEEAPYTATCQANQSPNVVQIQLALASLQQQQMQQLKLIQNIYRQLLGDSASVFVPQSGEAKDDSANRFTAAKEFGTTSSDTAMDTSGPVAVTSPWAINGVEYYGQQAITSSQPRSNCRSVGLASGRDRRKVSASLEKLYNIKHNELMKAPFARSQFAAGNSSARSEPDLSRTRSCSSVESASRYMEPLNAAYSNDSMSDTSAQDSSAGHLATTVATDSTPIDLSLNSESTQTGQYFCGVSTTQAVPYYRKYEAVSLPEFVPCSTTAAAAVMLQDANAAGLSAMTEDVDEDWESMMEITTSDEAAKIKMLVGDNDTKVTDPNQCIICHRILSCKR
ncbi:unnamed protein product [Soboliphyme baturini]|uniref:C2H2-type domain-containing protein n=1 Tax=Soboliphyme baturini TaxID=241478 RepID=A0A183IS45_9BILA|nr:unnamed protein product [Soboliphyme baturini]